jgi:hypothetical protein
VLLSAAKTHYQREIGVTEARVWVVLRSTVGQVLRGAVEKQQVYVSVGVYCVMVES